MPRHLQLLAVLYSLSLLALVIHMIRKGKLREEYALSWFGASVIIMGVSFSTQARTLLAELFGVVYPPALLLLLGLLFALALLLSQSVAISGLADRTRDLAQSLAILEAHFHQVASSSEPQRTRGDGSESTHGNRHTIMEQQVETAMLPGTQAQHDPSALPPRRKVLVIGLDGATFDLIKPWVEDGTLPTLGRLLREGAAGTLLSTLPPMTAPAWTSFATGTNPGKHRLYDWVAREPDSYRFSPLTARDCRVPTLYSLLSQAGRRVCALNIPMTYPPLAVNGVMVSGMPVPGKHVTYTFPEELAAQIDAAVGDYMLYPDPGQAYSDSGVDAFLERLYRCTDTRLRTFAYLRGRDAWDFAMMVLNGTDTICHALWKYMDRTHPLHDPKRYATYGDAIRQYYHYVDAQLATLVETLDEHTTLFVMSDHGFGPFHKFIHVNNFLMHEGFMRLRPTATARVKAALFRSGFAPMNVYNLLMRAGLGALKREVVRGNGRGLLNTFFLSFNDVDWSRTLCYSLGNVGQINLNVAGREPQGCVQPGAEYERVRDTVIARLWELRDEATGERVIEAVYRREEIYHGEQLEHAPDIVFIPRNLEYFGFGEYEFGSHKIIETMRRGISGTHRMHGIFIAYGSAIRPGTVVEGARLVDLAPTIMHGMGEAVPPHMDGRVLTEIFREGLRDVPASAPAVGWPFTLTQEEALSAEDARLLSERLRNLGYVG